MSSKNGVVGVCRVRYLIGWGRGMVGMEVWEGKGDGNGCGGSMVLSVRIVCGSVVFSRYPADNTSL